MIFKIFKSIKKRISNKTAKPVRYHTEDDTCPFCSLGTPIIYEQEYDCCTTCKTKWLIKQ